MSQNEGISRRKAILNFTDEYNKACNLEESYYLKFTSGFQISLEDNSFQAAECLLKKCPSFWRTNSNQLCQAQILH